jgi:hypothetical protein
MKETNMRPAKTAIADTLGNAIELHQVTVRQIAQAADVSEATARRWTDPFEPYVPDADELRRLVEKLPANLGDALLAAAFGRTHRFERVEWPTASLDMNGDKRIDTDDLRAHAIEFVEPAGANLRVIQRLCDDHRLTSTEAATVRPGIVALKLVADRTLACLDAVTLQPQRVTA